MHRFSGKSGVSARDWRRSVAAAARSKRDYVRTIKFPLELNEEVDLEFGKIANLFEVTEDISPHSLFGILMATHLAGFRFFPNARSNLSFRKLGSLEHDFQQAWVAQSSVAPKISPSALIEFALTPRRKVKGNAKSYDLQSIKGDLAIRFGIKPAELEEDTQAGKFFNTYAAELCDVASSWPELNENASGALALFDSLAEQHGFDLPKVADTVGDQQILTPAECSIAFDSALLVNSELEVTPIAAHQVVAQKLHMLRVMSVGAPKASDVQAVITTATNNALSWLFGRGFLYFRKSTLAEICTDFGVPDDRQEQIQALKEIFDEVPQDDLFGADHYSSFRSSVGGKVDSWLANYVAQLLRIEETLDGFEPWELNPALASEDATRYFRSMGLGFNDLLNLFEDIDTARFEARSALEVLLGKQDRLPNEDDVATIENFSAQISSFVGVLESLKNALKQDADSGQDELVALSKACAFSIPKWLKPLPKVNLISGGLPNIDGELKELEQSFRRVRQLKNSFCEQLMMNAESHSQLLPEEMIQVEREEELLAQRKMEGVNAEEQAKRQILNRLAVLGKSGTNDLRQILLKELAPLFSNIKDLRRLLNEGKGSIYVSPFSTGRHQPLDLAPEQLENCNPVTLARSVSEQLGERLLQVRDLATYRDRLRLESLINSLNLARLPVNVPVEWLPMEEVLELVHIPLSLLPLLAGETLNRQTVTKLSTLMTSQLNGFLARAFRESFFVRAKFVRVGVNELQWVPKEMRPWTPPKQVESSNSPLGLQISSLRSKDEFKEGPIDARLAAEALLSDSRSDWSRGCDLSALLQQMPHDWYVDLKLKGASKEGAVTGYGISKEKIRKASTTLNSPARLIGPSSFKTIIDRWLVDTNVSSGDYNLLFEQHFQQSVSLDEDLNPKVSVLPKVIKAEIALTITDSRESLPVEHPIGSSVIGIDLGEVGIGYAVFDVEEIKTSASMGTTPEPYESGAIPIRSVRDLIKRVKHHRRFDQARQRFRQGASTALQDLRDGAVGDVCFVIDALCAKHSGFPVLETSVVNLASGGKQLQLVYDRIVHTYWFSEIDAHKAARRHHWAGAENWEHPELFEETREKGEDGFFRPSGKSRPLKLFPGSAVHPAGTSQTCSKCGRNPYKAVDDSVADDGQSVFDVTGGCIELAGGDRLALKSPRDFSKSKDENVRDAKRYRRRKERPPIQYPVNLERIDRKSLMRQIRSQLRHPQKSTRSKDTTQSLYSCVFEDCQNNMHADENAAINIVRKWISDLAIH